MPNLDNELSADLDSQEIFFYLKPDDGIFGDVFKQHSIPSPFSSYNIKTKLKVKSIHLIEKLIAKLRQLETKEPRDDRIRNLNI